MVHVSIKYDTFVSAHIEIFENISY